MRRKKKHEAHVSHERWLVSYADFITLLFAFFVVLFSSSQVDHRKITKLAKAIQTAFQQLGIFQNDYTHPPLSTNGSLPSVRMRFVTAHVPPERIFDAMASATEELRERKSLAALRKELEAQLAPQIRRHVVSIVQNREGLVISLREIGFYPSGSATLKPASLPAVQRIAMLLLHRPEDIRFEGHTDNVPIHNAHYASNWELSVVRATRMLQLFIKRFEFQPERLSAAGYGQYHPIASNATAAGRALNRRVDIVVLAPRSPLPMLASGAPSQPAPEPQKLPRSATPKTRSAAASTVFPIVKELPSVFPREMPFAISPATKPKPPPPKTSEPPK